MVLVADEVKVKNFAGTVINPATKEGLDAIEALISAINAKITAVNTGAIVGTVTANQGGSWTVTANAGTNLNTSALALESTLSALNAKITACNTGATVVSSYPGPLAAQLPAALVSGRLDVNIGASAGLTATVSGSVTANAGTNLNTSALALESTLSALNAKVTAVNTGAVVISSGTLTANLGTIAGVSTETTLSALNTKVTACNTGAVVISSGSVTANAGTNLNTSALALESTLSSLNAKVTAVNTGAVVIASGTVTANAGTGTFTTADNQSITDNAAFTDGTSKVFLSGYVFDEVAGTALTENDAAAARIDSKRSQVLVLEDETTRGRRLTITASNAAKVDGSAVTQPISAASLPLPTGAALESTLSSLNAKVTACNTGAVVISSGTLTANLGTIAGVSTETTLSALNTKVTACNTGAVVLAAGSATVGSINNISGTISLPTGASTSANQSTEITALQLIDDIVHAAGDTLSKVAAIGGQYDDTSTAAPTEDKIHPARINKQRAIATGRVQSITADLSNVNTTYNNTTTTASSQDVDCDGYCWASLMFELTSASTPTDLQFIMEAKDEEDTDYRPIQNDFWGRLKIGAAEVASQQKYAFSRCPIPEGATNIRVRCVATGTDASKTFTLANAKIGLGTAA